MAHVLDLADAAAAGIERIGGKAAGLARLAALECEVPAGFAVTTERQREWMRAQGLQAEVDRLLADASDFDELRSVHAAIEQLFAAAELVDVDIDRAYDQLADGVDAPVAIRSSATAEDLAEASFAGQQETYLPVLGRDAVRRHIVKCWASLYAPHAVGYRRRLELDGADVAMAVVVQRMVPAEASGVMFTLDPLTGDPSQVTIEATFGLGLALVGGEATPDRYAIDKVTFEVRSRAIADKPFADRYDAASGRLVRTQLPAAEASAPCLTDEEAVALALTGKRIEQAFGHAMDIEWAIGAGPGGPRQAHLVQARPETVASARRAEASSAPRSALDRIVSTMRGTRD
jgi:phosphoenolpyruvate synthase/pyruvate phosphate dikinase